jgi:DNA-binding response OmpR family regulator
MKHILVVDDEPEALTFLEIVLKRNHYRPLLARDGAEALELLEKLRVDLILADVAMPRMNGYQLCQQIKNSSRLSWVLIPFIFISARTMVSDIRYGKSLGADDYLTKPFVVEDLLAVVKGKLLAAESLRTAFNQPLRLEGPEPIITLTICNRQLRLDYKRQRAWLDGEQLPLTVKETLLLTHLAQRPGRVMSDIELVKATHQLDRVDKQQARRKSVRSIISYLRRKLAPYLDGADCIQTVRGRGYVLCLDNEYK